MKSIISIITKFFGTSVILLIVLGIYIHFKTIGDEKNADYSYPRIIIEQTNPKGDKTHKDIELQQDHSLKIPMLQDLEEILIYYHFECGKGFCGVSLGNISVLEGKLIHNFYLNKVKEGLSFIKMGLEVHIKIIDNNLHFLIKHVR